MALCGVHVDEGTFGKTERPDLKAFTAVSPVVEGGTSCVVSA
jgi:hypothetical protein